jgi:hypothetical protein
LVSGHSLHPYIESCVTGSGSQGRSVASAGIELLLHLIYLSRV